MIRMLWDLGLRKITIKIVYAGPAMSGKTTSLRYIFEKFGRGDDLKSIETREGRTLFFDWGSIFIQKGQWKFQIDLWSATGQDFYAETRPTVLTGLDGVIFVADSQINLMKDNIASWKELCSLLGNKQKEIPIIIALNKRDNPDIVPINEFKEMMDIQNSTTLFETIATKGVNIVECFKTLVEKIFEHS